MKPHEQLFLLWNNAGLWKYTVPNHECAPRQERNTVFLVHIEDWVKYSHDKKDK